MRAVRPHRAMEAQRSRKTSNPIVLPWIGWEWPRPHTWQERTSLFGIRAGWWKAGRDQKSPIRRCFKSRPPLRTRCAGSPPAASHGCKERRDLQRPLLRERLDVQVLENLIPEDLVPDHLSDPRFFIPWRLSGLLSGYLPTDTRPQARAKLGKNANRAFATAAQ